MISSNTVERQIRGDFILRCNISSERVRADEICASSESIFHTVMNSEESHPPENDYDIPY